MIPRIAVMVLALAVLWPLEAASAPLQAPSAPPKAASFEQLSQSAERARNQNRSDEAIGFYQQALKLQPEWGQGLWYLSTLLYQKERYAEARDLLRRFVAEEPKAGPGWALLGMSEFHTREYARALDHLQRTTALGLGDRKQMSQSVFYVIAVLLTRFEQYDESMTLLYGLVGSGAAEAPLVEPAGLAALRMPLLPTEIPPDRREMIRKAGAGAFALYAQHYDEAEKLFRDIATTHPNEPSVHFLYGAFLMNTRPEEGIREMQRELEISPFHVPARMRLAEEFVKEGKLDQALPLAEEAVKFDSRNASAHMVYGEALVAKGDLSGGIRELEKARGQAPEMMRLRWDLFRAYTAAGRSEEASREKAEIEKLRPKGTG